MMKRAGGPRPTVSPLLNNRAAELGISPETQQRVLDIVRELGYRHNELVRSAVMGKNRRLGFLAYNYTKHVLRLLVGAMEESRQHGYGVEWHRLEGTREDHLKTTPFRSTPLKKLVCPCASSCAAQRRLRPRGC